MKKLAVIIMGPPGSGKGTQAGLLAEKLNLYYLETSKVIEEKVMRAKSSEFIKLKGKKYYFKDERNLWKKGKLCSPPFVSYLVKNKIKELFQKGQNLLLAGSPRTLYEGKDLIPLLKKLYEPKVILLKLSAKESVFRNSRRRICELMRHPILYSKETAKLKRCPLDGSKLVKRKGLDNPETIKVRLKEYKERTFPLIDYFKKQSLRVKEVNGEQSVTDVFNDILKSLK